MPHDTATSYMEWKPSETPDLAAARAVPDQPESLAPSLQSQYDHARRRTQNRFNSAYNQNIPNVTREAMLAQSDRDLTADHGTALSQSAWDANNNQFARRMGLAEMTLGRPLQNRQWGHTSQFPTQQGGGFWSNLLQAGATVGAAFI